VIDFRKRKVVHFESLGQSLELRQLSHAATAEMAAAHKADPGKQLFPVIAAKHGVIEWEALSTDEIASALTVDQLAEVSRAILDLSGVDQKNSESTPTDSSSSS